MTAFSAVLLQACEKDINPPASEQEQEQQQPLPNPLEEEFFFGAAPMPYENEDGTPGTKSLFDSDKEEMTQSTWYIFEHDTGKLIAAKGYNRATKISSLDLFPIPAGDSKYYKEHTFDVYLGGNMGTTVNANFTRNEVIKWSQTLSLKQTKPMSCVWENFDLTKDLNKLEYYDGSYCFTCKRLYSKYNIRIVKKGGAASNEYDFADIEVMNENTGVTPFSEISSKEGSSENYDTGNENSDKYEGGIRISKSATASNEFTIWVLENQSSLSESSFSRSGTEDSGVTYLKLSRSEVRCNDGTIYCDDQAKVTFRIPFTYEGKCCVPRGKEINMEIEMSEEKPRNDGWKTEYDPGNIHQPGPSEYFKWDEPGGMDVIAGMTYDAWFTTTVDDTETMFYMEENPEECVEILGYGFDDNTLGTPVIRGYVTFRADYYAPTTTAVMYGGDRDWNICAQLPLYIIGDNPRPSDPKPTPVDLYIFWEISEGNGFFPQLEFRTNPAVSYTGKVRLEFVLNLWYAERVDDSHSARTMINNQSFNGGTPIVAGGAQFYGKASKTLEVNFVNGKAVVPLSWNQNFTAAFGYWNDWYLVQAQCRSAVGADSPGTVKGIMPNDTGSYEEFVYGY